MTHNKIMWTKCLKKPLVMAVLVTLALLLLLIFLENPFVNGLIESSDAPTDEVSQKTRKEHLNVSISKGNINGIPVAVPNNYLRHAFEYNDKSVWEAHKPGDKPLSERSFNDGVGAFAVQVRWPDMSPRSIGSSLDSNNWITIDINDAYATDPKPPQVQGNGLARMLRGDIKKLSESLQRRRLPPVDTKELFGKTELVSASYELRGVDDATGLQWAEPVSPGTIYYEGWNKVLYWKGNVNSVVTDFIKCTSGELRNSNDKHKCYHRTIFPEWNSYMNIQYPREMLIKWKEIKARSQELFIRFQVDIQDESVLSK